MAGRRRADEVLVQFSVSVTPGEKQLLESQAIPESDTPSLSAVARAMILRGLGDAPVTGRRPARRGEVLKLPKVLNVPCGLPESLHDLYEAVGEAGVTVEVGPPAAALVTRHSFVARAVGDSMLNMDLPTSICPDDDLLMTPVAEYPRDIVAGTIILAEICWSDGREGCTLKEYRGKRLSAHNPQVDNIEFGPDVIEVRVIAVCRCRLARVFV